MDVLRRNTDYGFRIMVNLAKRYNGEFISARQLAEDGHFSYQLGCKILQKLHKAGLV
ncbi:MAG: Rrf2 family transcriptional regulator, partial [Sedimentisphaerales bacterium]|nr:Rrf2 family transcriptional regulator [Sedimentisphaerales bacterium]